MSELVVLFEDHGHESFARQVIKRCYGYAPRMVRYLRCVDCTGVERALAGEVTRLRSRNFQRGRALLVLIDADAFGIDGRKERLDAMLRKAGMDPRRDDERIAYVVPRLEVENWYMHFCVPARRPTDENHDYKRDPDWRALADNLGAAARAVARAWRTPAALEPLSLQDARSELARLVIPA